MDPENARARIGTYADAQVAKAAMATMMDAITAARSEWEDVDVFTPGEPAAGPRIAETHGQLRLHAFQRRCVARLADLEALPHNTVAWLAAPFGVGKTPISIATADHVLKVPPAAPKILRNGHTLFVPAATMPVAFFFVKGSVVGQWAEHFALMGFGRDLRVVKTHQQLATFVADWQTSPERVLGHRFFLFRDGLTQSKEPLGSPAVPPGMRAADTSARTGWDTVTLAAHTCASAGRFPRVCVVDDYDQGAFVQAPLPGVWNVLVSGSTPLAMPPPVVAPGGLPLARIEAPMHPLIGPNLAVEVADASGARAVLSGHDAVLFHEKRRRFGVRTEGCWFLEMMVRVREMTYIMQLNAGPVFAELSGESLYVSPEAFPLALTPRNLCPVVAAKPAYVDAAIRLPRYRTGVVVLHNPNDRIIGMLGILGGNVVAENMNGLAVHAAAAALGITVDTPRQMFQKVLGSKYHEVVVAEKDVYKIEDLLGHLVERCRHTVEEAAARYVVQRELPEDAAGRFVDKYLDVRLPMLAFPTYRRTLTADLKFSHRSLVAAAEKSTLAARARYDTSSVAIERVRRHLTEQRCSVCAATMQGCTDGLFVLSCCGHVVCGGCMKTVVFGRDARTGRCVNCKGPVTVASAIFISKDTDIAALASGDADSDELVVGPPPEPVPDSSTGLGRRIDRSKHDIKLRALLYICSGLGVPFGDPNNPGHAEAVYEADMFFPNVLGSADAPTYQGSTPSTLVFATCPESVGLISGVLAEFEISSGTLHHPNGRINFDVLRRFRAREIRVLVVCSRQECASLNLQMADELVFFNKISDLGTASQVIGRMQRVGRTSCGRLWFLAYENEVAMLAQHARPLSHKSAYPFCSDGSDIPEGRGGPLPDRSGAGPAPPAATVLQDLAVRGHAVTQFVWGLAALHAAAAELLVHNPDAEGAHGAAATDLVEARLAPGSLMEIAMAASAASTDGFREDVCMMTWFNIFATATDPRPVPAERLVQGRKLYKTAHGCAMNVLYAWKVPRPALDRFELVLVAVCRAIRDSAGTGGAVAEFCTEPPQGLAVHLRTMMLPADLPGTHEPGLRDILKQKTYAAGSQGEIVRAAMHRADGGPRGIRAGHVPVRARRARAAAGPAGPAEVPAHPGVLPPEVGAAAAPARDDDGWAEHELAEALRRSMADQ